VVTAAATISSANSPWTRVSMTVNANPNALRRSSSWKSCHAAVPTLVTTPTRNGIGDSGRCLFASSRPSATSRRMTSSRDWAMSPSVYFGSMPVILRPIRPLGA
jgi:hypothetical protein